MHQGSNQGVQAKYLSTNLSQVQNTNGLLRQYFPKSMRLVDIAYEAARIVVHKLNSRH